MAAPLHVTFAAGDTGTWTIDAITAVTGPALPDAHALSVYEGSAPVDASTVWSLRGVVGHERYVTRAERAQLESRQEGLGRASSTAAVLIPIRKSDAWWSLPQDERRE